MKATQIAKTSVKAGDRTSLGTDKSTELSPSGKTIKITVTGATGDFTDRISAAGDMFIFTD